MGAPVGGHVDALERGDQEAERAFEHRLGLADEGDDGAVGLRARIDVQDLHARRRAGRSGDRLVDLRTTTFGDVRNTLDDTHAASSLARES